MPRHISLGRFRRVGMALLAALFTALAGVATNRVQGIWWTQTIFFTASVFSLFAAGILAGTAAHRNTPPRKIRKTRQRVITKVLPSHYRHEKPVWLNSGLLSELAIPAEYEILNSEPKSKVGRDIQSDCEIPISVSDAFNYSGGQLLILGDAGSGKTHALFQIIENALVQCARNQDQPIPFYIDLTAWDGHSNTFDRWCASYISMRYKISEDYVKHWLDDSDIALVCDGLDELTRKARENCVSAINQFRQRHGLISVVVASRSQEYSDTPRRLQLHGCLRLKPLPVATLLAELANFDSRNAGISEKVAKDSRLRDLLRTPLFLNLFAQAYYGNPPENIVRRGRSWRRAIIDAYLDQAEQRGMTHYNGADLGLRSWLPPIINRMMAQHQTVIYPDRLPLAQLDNQIRSQIQRRTTWIVSVLATFIMLAVRIPTLIAIRNYPSFPGFIIGSTVLIPATSIFTWRYCKWAVTERIVFRYRLDKGTRTRVALVWAFLYGLLGTAASVLLRLSPSAPLIIFFMICAAAVGTYPFFGMMHHMKPDADTLPRYPGEETRSLVSFNLTFTGIVIGCEAVSLFLVTAPIMTGSKGLSLAASAYVIPYFLTPVALIAWIRSGGLSVIYVYVARKAQGKLGLLPAKYMSSFQALRSSSILVPAGGGYAVVHSLVRDHLATRAENLPKRARHISTRAVGSVKR